MFICIQKRLKFVGGFHKWGYPYFSSIYRWIFPNKNHPAIKGYPYLRKPRSPWCSNNEGPRISDLPTKHCIESTSNFWDVLKVFAFHQAASWLVVLEHLVYFSICWECHFIPTDSIIFQRGRWVYHQPDMVKHIMNHIKPYWSILNPSEGYGGSTTKQLLASETKGSVIPRSEAICVFWLVDYSGISGSLL